MLLNLTNFLLSNQYGYTESKFWNEMPENFTSSFHFSHNTFVYRVKQYLKSDLIKFYYSIEFIKLMKGKA